MNGDKSTIRKRALELVSTRPRGVASTLATEFGLSRQVANGYLQALQRDGLIEAEGTTRARVHRLATLVNVGREFVREGLDEDKVWREVAAPHLDDLPRNVRDIWHYGSTEMINNAIDHSGSDTVTVGLVRNAFETRVTVTDRGEGIFLKIQRALGLPDPRASILELAKGKLTTAPARHSGEGIFFTSRVMDGFEIESHNLRFSHEVRRDDMIAEQNADTPGTTVRMRLVNDSPRSLNDVFDEFADGEELTFGKTVVPLRLAQHGDDKLISRSQAKRVVHGFDRFKRVELDFTGVEGIGQAFADELFRVWATAHPDIRLVPTNTAPMVAKMIRRVTGATAADGESIG